MRALAVTVAALLAGPAALALPHDGVPDLGGSCEDCHTTEGWRVIPERITTFDHAQTGFPLWGQHANATCTGCHGEGLEAASSSTACGSCHDDAHRGELGGACEDCHTPLGWAQSAAFLRHRETRFPLSGTHAVADCTACHLRSRKEVYAGTPTECVACHADDARRPGVHLDHVAAGFRDACDTCHSQYLWQPARIRHDLYWPLRGSHTATQCASCHVGARFGGTPTDCYACHQADYQAATDPPHASFGISRSCERCHSDVAWSTTRQRWHDSFFPLSSGDHSRYDCKDCHFGDAVSPVNFTCIGCHKRGGTTAEHDDVSGYVWENFACYACHPDGSE